MTKNIKLVVIAVLAILFIWAGFSIKEAWTHVSTQAEQSTMLMWTVGWLLSPAATAALLKILTDE
jgi:hypothetical protein